jgi:hypothetical protein
MTHIDRGYDVAIRQRRANPTPEANVIHAKTRPRIVHKCRLSVNVYAATANSWQRSSAVVEIFEAAIEAGHGAIAALDKANSEVRTWQESN